MDILATAGRDNSLNWSPISVYSKHCIHRKDGKFAKKLIKKITIKKLPDYPWNSATGHMRSEWQVQHPLPA